MSETVDEQEAILREGVGLKLVLSGEELGQKAAQSGKELEANGAEVSLLAALQHNQEQEAEYLLRDLAVKVIFFFKIAILCLEEMVSILCFFTTFIRCIEKKIALIRAYLDPIVQVWNKPILDWWKLQLL